MKKLGTIVSIALSLFVMACEGPAGLDGYDGRDGNDGDDGINILGKVIDIEGDFTSNNDYSIYYEFTNAIEVFETDIILIYILWDQTEDSNGEAVDIWRLLPQTRILDQGILQYNYDHTFLDVNIFLESDFDLATLTSGDTNNQVFRIAVLPAENLQGSRLNKSDINAVMQTLGVSENDIQKVIIE